MNPHLSLLNLKLRSVSLSYWNILFPVATVLNKVFLARFHNCPHNFSLRGIAYMGSGQGWVAKCVPTEVTKEKSQRLYIPYSGNQKEFQIRSDEIIFPCHQDHDGMLMEDSWWKQIRGIILHSSLASLYPISVECVGGSKLHRSDLRNYPDVRGEQHTMDGREEVTSQGA